MTPRPEDVALLRRLLATIRVFSGEPHVLHIGLTDDELATLHALASRLEGEGRDGEPRGLARFRLWLEGAMRTHPSDKVYHLPSMPHTLDCRNCGRTTGLVRLVPASPTPEGTP